MSSKTRDKKKKNAEKGSKRREEREREFKKGQVLKMMLIRKAFNVIIRSHLKVERGKFVLDVSEKDVRRRIFFIMTIKLSRFLKISRLCLSIPFKDLSLFHHFSFISNKRLLSQTMIKAVATFTLIHVSG